MILVSKFFTKLWLYLLLLSPSWSISAYEVFNGLINGEGFDVIFNRASEILFVLAPLDRCLVSDPTLRLYGLVLLGIWLYIVVMACKDLLGAWMLPVAPLIWWLLGKGMPNTFGLLSGYLPDWLLAYSGLPLILLTCSLIGLILLFFKRRRR